MSTFESLIPLFEKYIRSVGIEDLIHSVDGKEKIWAGQYSQIGVFQVDECSKNSILCIKERGQEILDGFLFEMEKDSSTVIDGYLVFVLPEPPDDKIRETIREIEMDTAVCRKHFVWPENRDSLEKVWNRIFQISVLGLPPSLETAGGANMPALSEFQQSIWNRIRDISAASAAVKILQEKLNDK
jgi:hypothetical protein